MSVVVIFIVIVIMGRRGRGPVQFFGRGDGKAGGFIGEREQRVALGAGKPAAALFAGKKYRETSGQKQTEEDCDRYDGHAWNVWNEYRTNPPD